MLLLLGGINGHLKAYSIPIKVLVDNTLLVPLVCLLHGSDSGSGLRRASGAHKQPFRTNANANGNGDGDGDAPLISLTLFNSINLIHPALSSLVCYVWSL